MTRHIAVLLMGTLASTIVLPSTRAASTQVLAVSGETVPGTTSVLSNVLDGPLLNDSGVVAFGSGLPPGGDPSISGIYLARDGQLFQVAHTGLLAPPGATTYKLLTPLQLSVSGQVLFRGSQLDGSDERMYLGDEHTTHQLLASGDPLPDASGSFLSFGGNLNSSNQFGFSSTIVVNHASDGAVFLLDGGQFTQVARTGQSGPGGAPFTTVAEQHVAINDSGQLAFLAAYAGGPTQSLLRFNGNSYTVLYQGGASPRGDGTLTNLDSFVFNNLGQAAFATQDIVGDPANPLSRRTALFRADGNSLNEVVRTGDPAPGGSGTISIFRTSNSFNVQPLLNNRGQLAFEASISGSIGGSADGLGLFLTDPAATSSTEVARTGQPTPDGNAFLSFPSTFAFPLLNTMSLSDHGDVAFVANLTGPSVKGPNDLALYLWCAGQMVQVARKGDPLLGSTISGFGLFQLNNADQIAYIFNLADGRFGIALWAVPEPVTVYLFAIALIAPLNVRRARPPKA